LSFARVAGGPQFSLFARTRQPSGPWEPSGPRLFDPFTATDDRGTTIYGPDGLHSWPPIWIRDSGGRWHATRTSGQSGMDGEIALRLEIVPPLSQATTWIDVRATGQSAQARAILPLRWQAL
jgi:hypothetical protein